MIEVNEAKESNKMPSLETRSRLLYSTAQTSSAGSLGGGDGKCRWWMAGVDRSTRLIDLKVRETIHLQNGGD